MKGTLLGCSILITIRIELFINASALGTSQLYTQGFSQVISKPIKILFCLNRNVLLVYNYAYSMMCVGVYVHEMGSLILSDASCLSEVFSIMLGGSVDLQC